MKLEHRCWCPPGYKKGLEGQRVAICGFSHYSDEGDDEELTNIVLNDVINGAAYRFFTSISRSFGFDSVPDFWSSVLFFNFIPVSVGASDNRYASGTSDQIVDGRARVLRLIGSHKPHKLFVFSRKAWQNFPPTFEESIGLPLNEPLGWGTYKSRGLHRTIAIGLRHPQFAQFADLESGARLGLAIPTA